MTLLVITIVVALAFDFTNGFHDTANAVATSVSTRALSPRLAVLIAAVANLAGAFATTAVAKTVGKGIIDSGLASTHTVLAAVIGAIVWNLITWWLGLPSSSTHALIGGLIGAALASAGTVHWNGVLDKVVIPMVASPLIGLVLGWTVMLAILWAFRHRNAHRLNRGFRRLQVGSAAAMAYSHGTQDAQKTMGVITLALVTSGHLKSFHVPVWVIIASATAMGFGTYAGGWRIIRTLGRRIVALTPPSGFAAELSASTVLLFSAYAYALPVSSTHVITSTVMGVGATRRRSAVRWGVAGNIIGAWILTIPGAAAAAATTFAIGHLAIG
ncbi:MAG TPA: inorganic phosphate transporter [Solirubrobacteraceae bacterium]|nr:inorganic phosphate transporter [Solirubrobacteraceae bacterium]